MFGTFTAAGHRCVVDIDIAIMRVVVDGNHAHPRRFFRSIRCIRRLGQPKYRVMNVFEPRRVTAWSAQ